MCNSYVNPSQEATPLTRQNLPSPNGGLIRGDQCTLRIFSNVVLILFPEGGSGSGGDMPLPPSMPGLPTKTGRHQLA